MQKPEKILSEMESLLDSLIESARKLAMFTCTAKKFGQVDGLIN